MIGKNVRIPVLQKFQQLNFKITKKHKRVETYSEKIKKCLWVNIKSYVLTMIIILYFSIQNFETIPWVYLKSLPDIFCKENKFGYAFHIISNNIKILYKLLTITKYSYLVFNLLTILVMQIKLLIR